MSALFAGIHEVHDNGSEMGECGDGLHLDGVALLQRVVQDSGSVDNLYNQGFSFKYEDRKKFYSIFSKIINLVRL